MPVRWGRVQFGQADRQSDIVQVFSLTFGYTLLVVDQSGFFLIGDWTIASDTKNLPIHQPLPIMGRFY